ncbi:MAG: hypothetical protein Q7R39_01735 [Dehalococcoidia bacterium]|nr:hypothetical protein [Dehalococcoidia bacterium]
MFDLDRLWLSVACPKCGYDLDFTYLQARLQELVLCSCCKNSIELVDQEADVETSKRRINEAVSDLNKAFKKLNRSLKFNKM